MIKKLNGWIFIDKPPDISSFDVIKIVKKILKINKLGHSGTLDPFATGVLAIALGEATKSIKYFNSEKKYDFDITFGESKDFEGSIFKPNHAYKLFGTNINCVSKPKF